MPAPRTIWFYILRDASVHALLGLGVFTFIIVLQNLLRFLERLLGTGVGGEEIVRLAGIILPTYLPYAIPTSLLFGIIVTFGRMSADGEIIAIRAAGVSVTQLLPPVVVVGALATLVTAYLSFEIAPGSYYRLKMLVRDLSRGVKLIRPTEFRALGPDRVVYVESEGSPPCGLRGVMVADFSDIRRPFYIFSQCGRIADRRSQVGLALELQDGSIHFEGDTADRYRRIRFRHMRTEFDVGTWIRSTRRARDYTMLELLRIDHEFDQGMTPRLGGAQGQNEVRTEIHGRFAFSMASLLLSVLAVALGIRPLRAGRSGGALTAIGLMAVYWLLFSVGEIAAERRLLAPWMAIWTPNVLALAAGILLLRQTARGEC